MIYTINGEQVTKQDKIKETYKRIERAYWTSKDYFQYVKFCENIYKTCQLDFETFNKLKKSIC